MVIFANCKINLGLRVTGKRSDGFHNLETVFYPVNFCDVLEIITSNDTATPVSFSSSGIPLNVRNEDNICVKACTLIKKNYPHLSPLRMYLHKSVPIGAGLGGGSADGAFTLKLLNVKYNLGLSMAQLRDYALQLGSDCPFFILNKPVLATGRGEIMQDLPLDLAAYKLVIVNPGLHINTGWAFSQMTSFDQGPPIETIIVQPIQSWKEQLSNDFEVPVINRYPELMKIKDQLYERGALYAAMSGSGSTFFGIFHKSVTPEINGFPEEYLVKEVDFL